MVSTEQTVMLEDNGLRFLLLEIAEALVTRGTLTADDIAGALLRAEWGAEILDGVAEEEGDITPLHAVLAKATTEQWSSRFGIEPSLCALRKLHAEWLASGQKGLPPLDPAQVIEWSRDDGNPG